MSSNKYYDEGRQAYIDGKDIDDDNPYENCSFNWILGYISAEKAAKENARLAAVQEGAK